jgi:small subunit ribosomal protein S11
MTALRIPRRNRKNIVKGIAHIKATFNNTLITITDHDGNAITWSSAGAAGFKGSRKGTPYAAQLAAEDCARKAQEHGLAFLSVEISGPGPGREAAVRALHVAGFVITDVKDVTPVPHNGCRTHRRKRV